MGEMTAAGKQSASVKAAAGHSDGEQPAAATASGQPSTSGRPFGSTLPLGETHGGLLIAVTVACVQRQFIGACCANKLTACHACALHDIAGILHRHTVCSTQSIQLPTPAPRFLPCPAGGIGLFGLPPNRFDLRTQRPLDSDSRLRDSLKFVFSPEGAFFREFIMDEIVKSVDALSREQFLAFVQQVQPGQRRGTGHSMRTECQRGA